MNRTPQLTERQEEVLRLIMEGRTHAEIGALLGIATRTAKAHSDVLRVKLGAEKARHLIGYGYEYFANQRR